MKILLTGPNSFCGKFILRQFINKGHDVTVISRNKASQNFGNNVQCIYGDLSSIKQIEGSFDVVVHIAATAPPVSTTYPLIQDNILATQNLINLVKNLSIQKFIFFSTCSVYGEVNQPILNESTPIYKPHVYGTSKLMCEAMLREQKWFQSITIRLPAVMGNGAARHWLASTIHKAKAGETITLNNPDALFNNAIYVNELAVFVETLLHTKLHHDFDCINVASKDGLPIINIVEKIIKKFNSSSVISIEDNQKTSFVISSQYAIDNYAFKPLAFKEALNYYLEDIT
ncbi:MAG: SDR family oxidoreductase [Legionellaceae bacterium]|nr:SDR family oxidoreductase [Legionellaceae bacterium]